MKNFIPSQGERCVLELWVTPEFCGMRLDKFLVKCLPHYSRVFIQNVLEAGYVESPLGILSKKHQSMKVSLGTLFRIEIPQSQPSVLKPIAMNLEILYEDEDIMVINKPAGQVVHPSMGHREDSLVHGLLAHCQDQLSHLGGLQRPGIVHRLDQFTSGVLLVAKHDVAHHHLSTQFAQRSVYKTYWAIVYGAPVPPLGRIEVNIGRDPRQPLRMSVSLTKGKYSITRYRTKMRSQCGKYSFLECFPETGRTHQIRVHLSHLGHGIVGDQVYSRSHKDLPRQGLHAYQLSFVHPITFHPLCITRELPEDMMTFLHHYF
ncbi:RluA family pseudouridine synthase [Holospora curviuscula]|uniref:Pseudouridine synthase n=1 Tax=Holospora curviuscula TaxID=1082868 RepID=A0A2S5R773_9PROT|nr:RluA family pseudouridine synthase [Holospora curviuscula]PPE03191.1 Ribosomal large subunit pseudouridine synthase D [Holospora curviuscula]